MATAGAPPRGGSRRERLARRVRRSALLLRQVAAAVILGVATLFMLKTEADQHWSDPPVIAVIATYEQAAHPGESS